MVSPQQSLVLAEARCLLVWLGVQRGVLHSSAAEAILATTFCNEVVDLEHGQSRCVTSALHTRYSLRLLLGALRALSCARH